MKNNFALVFINTPQPYARYNEEYHTWHRPPCPHAYSAACSAGDPPIRTVTHPEEGRTMLATQEFSRLSEFNSNSGKGIQSKGRKY